MRESYLSQIHKKIMKVNGKMFERKVKRENWTMIETLNMFCKWVKTQSNLSF